MQHTLDVARRLAEHHCGAVLAADLRRAGADPQDVDRLLQDRRWGRLLKGVYLTHSGSATWPARAHAAVLHAGPGSVVTGLLGARWLGMRWIPEPEAVHVLVAPEVRRRSSASWVRVRRAADLAQIATWSTHGLRIAEPSRLVVDGARELQSLGEVRGLVLGAVADGWCGELDLRVLLDGGAVAGTALCRRAARDAGRGAASPPEAELVDQLLTRGVPFLSNPELTLDGVVIGRPDAYLLGTGVGAELDSDERHSAPELLDLTLQRDRRFSRSGLLLEHITPRRFRSDPSGFVDLLLASAQGRLAGPGPAEPPGLVVTPRGPVLGRE